MAERGLRRERRLLLLTADGYLQELRGGAREQGKTLASWCQLSGPEERTPTGNENPVRCCSAAA